MYNPKNSYLPTPTYKRNYSRYYDNTIHKIQTPYSNYNKNVNDPKTNIINEDKSKNEKKETETRGINNMFQFSMNEVLFEIFGLKIYFDDLLIICILLFLYQEGINDEYLFICLILLLLSWFIL